MKFRKIGENLRFVLLPISGPEMTLSLLAQKNKHETKPEDTIGKIAGEQLIKLMTLGLTEQEAEEQIVNGFLK